MAAADRRIKELEESLEKQRGGTVCIATEHWTDWRVDWRPPADDLRRASEHPKRALLDEPPPPYEQKAADPTPDFYMRYCHLGFETYPDVYEDKFTHTAIEPASTLLPAGPQRSSPQRSSPPQPPLQEGPLPPCSHEIPDEEHPDDITSL
jgi:hypothetical protein